MFDYVVLAVVVPGRGGILPVRIFGDGPSPSPDRVAGYVGHGTHGHAGTASRWRLSSDQEARIAQPPHEGLRLRHRRRLCHSAGQYGKFTQQNHSCGI